MATNDSISAQGTIIRRNGTVIGNVRDITPPPLSRKEIEMTAHSDTEEVFVVGIRRKGPFTFNIGYNPANATHDNVAGLIKAMIDGSYDGYEVEFPNGKIWAFSGYVTNFAPKAPVDDALTADVTIRPSDAMSFA